MSECQHEEIERLHEEIAAFKKRIDQTQRKTAPGELVSTTTHEFNNVLITIINFAGTGMRLDDQETRGKAFEEITEEITRRGLHAPCSS